MAYGEVDQGAIAPIEKVKKPTLQSLYQARNLKAAKQTQAIRKPTKVEGTPLARTEATGLSKIAQPTAAKEFNVGGTMNKVPDGVPPGVSSMSPAWDYNRATGKYLTGSEKENARQKLWTQYRNMQKNRGRKMSGFGSSIVNRPYRVA